MHFPTPHLKKSEKRKASNDSGGDENDGAVLERKLTRKERKAKRAKEEKHEERNEEVPETSMVPEHEPIERTSSPLSLRSTTSSQISPATTRKDSAQEPSSPTRVPTTTTTLQDPLTKSPTTEDAQDAPSPRRSSRIRNSMHSVATTWTKARPYIERLNGTIMPLQPQGVEPYHAREGVRVD